MNGPATSDERDAIDQFCARHGIAAIDQSSPIAVGGIRRARQNRHLLLPALHAVVDRVGWVSEAACRHVADRLDVAAADVYGVASFYDLIPTAPRTAIAHYVCDDIACALVGGRELAAIDGAIASACLGQCDRAPAVLVREAGVPARDRQLAPAVAQGQTFGAKELPLFVGSRGPLLRRVGRIDPESLDDYVNAGGFTALRRAQEMGATRVIDEIEITNLRGRGGAAFPTAQKWRAVATSARAPHYVVANADESEPGTFKDRVLMEGDPFAVIEALAIAGLATGAEKGFLYVRGEYPLAFARLAHAISVCYERGLLGSFVVELRKGAGAYVCGEETALFNSIEGFRGEPRNKPPFPTESGLFGAPTVVNNVETLVNVLAILTDGGAEHARNETRLYCLSGHVDRPGVYEVTMGTPLRQLLELAGVTSRLRFLLLGGAAGVVLRPDQLDVELSFEGARAAGVTLGSGVVMAFDETVAVSDVLARIARFFRHESCGQCVPCRVGTVRQAEALDRLRAGGSAHDRDVLIIREVGQAMRDASICGLGQTASSAIESALSNRMLEDLHP